MWKVHLGEAKADGNNGIKCMGGGWMKRWPMGGMKESDLEWGEQWNNQQGWSGNFSWSILSHRRTSAEEVCLKSKINFKPRSYNVLYLSTESNKHKKWCIYALQAKFCDVKHKHACAHTHTSTHTPGSAICDLSLVVVRQHDEVCGD